MGLPTGEEEPRGKGATDVISVVIDVPGALTL